MFTSNMYDDSSDLWMLMIQVIFPFNLKSTPLLVATVAYKACYCILFFSHYMPVMYSRLAPTELLYTLFHRLHPFD